MRTLFGKVRLINGKRAIEPNVVDLITDGYNSMPSYRNMFRPDDWTYLLAYLKTLRSRPEFASILQPIRGSDEDILASGKNHFTEHCAPCHDGAKAKAPSLLQIYKREENPITQLAIVARVREGHGGMPPQKDVLDDAVLFCLIAYLKAQ